MVVDRRRRGSAYHPVMAHYASAYSTAVVAVAAADGSYDYLHAYQSVLCEPTMISCLLVDLFVLGVDCGLLDPASSALVEYLSLDVMVTT